MLKTVVRLGWLSLYRKPFQRLLKYSALFQALLSHTDPWMHEYEGALQLVAEVEISFEASRMQRIKRRTR
jgi:hypothetical protein